MMDQLDEIVRIAKESLEVQKELLDLTKGVHKELRGLKILITDKIPG